uniref:Uncharacterized protein n=1 Tax=Rhizophora mucronata TaxID=61149 RepID=A0A2P2PJL6_RHIMU
MKLKKQKEEKGKNLKEKKCKMCSN